MVPLPSRMSGRSSAEPLAAFRFSVRLDPVLASRQCSLRGKASIAFGRVVDSVTEERAEYGDPGECEAPTGYDVRRPMATVGDHCHTDRENENPPDHYSEPTPPARRHERNDARGRRHPSYRVAARKRRMARHRKR